jgi:hypothetical protein
MFLSATDSAAVGAVLTLVCWFIIVASETSRAC